MFFFTKIAIQPFPFITGLSLKKKKQGKADTSTKNIAK